MSQKPLRILHVMAGGTVGGAENIYQETVAALAASPDMVQGAVTRPVADRLALLGDAGVQVYTARFNKWWPFPTRSAIKKAVADFKPDVIQYWMGRAGQFTVPVTVGENAQPSHVNVAWYGGYYNRLRRFPLCSHHVVLTDDLRRHVRESGVPDRDITLIPTLANFDENAAPIDRANLDTPTDAPVLLALARLHWKKGLDVLLKSLVEVPEAYAWIAGDGPLRDELHKLANDLGVMDRVRFLGWRTDREQLLKACDICVFPSRYEPFGTVMVDAWAAKVPLIAADAQGPKATMRDGENGLLIPKDDVDALVSSIRRFIAEPDLRVRCVEGGWQDYQSTYTPKAVTAASLAMYQNLVQEKLPSASQEKRAA